MKSGATEKKRVALGDLDLEASPRLAEVRVGLPPAWT
jgi:hypothetical protein